MSIQLSAKPELSYLKALLDQCRQDEPIVGGELNATLQQLRDQAAAIVEELAIPSRRDEEWRFTDLSPLLAVNFQGVEAFFEQFLQHLDLTSLNLPETPDSQLVFVNGVYAPDLSSVSGLPEGVYVGNLAGLPAAYEGKIPNYLGKQQGASDVFAALNTSGLTDAAVVWIPKNRIVETPIHLLFISTTDDVPVICQPRCLVIAEAGSVVNLIEHYAANVEGCPDIPVNRPYFNNQVTEIWIEDNAQVIHTRNQREAMDGFHIGKT
ncbi:MAG: Fe-S cluster assembly protein SufD, partial [Coleofasciculus sp. C2-GNP5-27]